MKDIEFIRYAGLSSVKQKGYNSKMPTFHSPPAHRGIYAFVANYVEPFLLGTNKFDPRRMEWLRDKDGNRIKEDDVDWDDPKNNKYMSKWLNSSFENEFKEACDNDDVDKMDEIRKRGQFVAKDCNRKRFKYKGDIWHHLDVKHHEIILCKGEWVLTSFEAYKKALQCEIAGRKAYKATQGWDICMDSLEVFIEKV